MRMQERSSDKLAERGMIYSQLRGLVRFWAELMRIV
jgi:hypothetical protein